MRSIIVGTVLALATLFAVPAMAGEGKDKANFPMKGAEFKQKVDARQAKAREHMEKRASKMSAEEAKQLRAKFDAGVAKINVEVNKAVADGTVTKEEADSVRKVSREVHPHHGKHARRGGKKAGKK
jgi:hypothetical protein